MGKFIFYFMVLTSLCFSQNALLAAPVTVDSGGEVGQYTSIIMVNGHPAISYYDIKKADLKYVRASNAEGTAWNTPVTVDSGGEVGQYTSIIMVNGHPAISYYDIKKKKFKYVRASNAEGTAWNTPVTVDSVPVGEVGKYTSMIIVDGNPAISYSFDDAGASSLKYVRASNVNGTAWNTPVTVDNKLTLDEKMSMIIVDGNPAIGYCDDGMRVKYVRASNVKGTAWNTPVIVVSQDAFAPTSMIIVNGNPAICYKNWIDSYSLIRYVRASNAKGTAWNTPVRVGSEFETAWFLSMALVNGNPAISYSSRKEGDLKYVRASNVNGTAWKAPIIVDSIGTVGYYLSMTMVNNNPAISYYDSTKKDLKFALAQMNLYFPHVASNSTWETEICIINTNGFGRLTGTIMAFDNSGALVCSKSVDLNSRGRKSIIVGTEFPNPSNIGYIIFESDSTYVSGYTKFYVAGKYRVAIPATSWINVDKDIYISHIASNNKWWTGLSLVNTTFRDRNLVIEFDNNIKKSVLLGPRQHKAFSIKGLFSGVLQPGIKSAVIKNAQGVIGLELFGSTKGAKENYLSGILLNDKTAKKIYYPHITSTATWWTGIIAYNPAAVTNDLTITSYKEDGTALGNKLISLQSKAKYMGTSGGLKLPKKTAWFQIDANYAVTGFELFGKTNGKQLAGYTVVNINSKAGIFPKVEKDGWTGVAFVNINNYPTKVTMKAYDDSGKLIRARVLFLQAHEKYVGLVNSIFGSIDSATYIVYQSTLEIVGFQLNGSTTGMLLDALPGG